MSELSFNGKIGLANSSRYSAEFQKDSCALRHWAAVTSPSPSSMAYRSVTFPSGITSTAVVTSTATGRSSESTNYRHGATYGSLAYDLDALAREKQLDEAGKLPQKKVRPAQPEVQPVQRRQSAARAAVRPSPVLLLGTVLVVGMVIALMLCYVKLTGISDNVSSIKREISALEEEHVALLTAYERTFDLATGNAASAGSSSSQGMEYTPSNSSSNVVAG